MALYYLSSPLPRLLARRWKTNRMQLPVIFVASVSLVGPPRRVSPVFLVRHLAHFFRPRETRALSLSSLSA